MAYIELSRTKQASQCLKKKTRNSPLPAMHNERIGELTLAPATTKDLRWIWWVIEWKLNGYDGIALEAKPKRRRARERERERRRGPIAIAGEAHFI